MTDIESSKQTHTGRRQRVSMSLGVSLDDGGCQPTDICSSEFGIRPPVSARPTRSQPQHRKNSFGLHRVSEQHRSIESTNVNGCADS